MRAHSARLNLYVTRRGVTITETAVVLPIFFIILFGVFEFGHVFMTVHTLNAAARRAARLGVSETSNTSQVITLAEQIVGRGIDVEDCVIEVKDASIFDTAGADAADISFDSLPDIELADAERRQLFAVRVRVNYSDVAILGPRWAGGLQISGQCVLRRE